MPISWMARTWYNRIRVDRHLGNASLALSSLSIAFDRYDSGVSIKTPERQRRGSFGLLIRHLVSDPRKQTSSELTQVSEGICNKVNQTNYILNYILENAVNIHEKLIILAGGFSIEKLVKNVTRFVLSSLECITVTQGEPTGE